MDSSILATLHFIVVTAIFFVFVIWSVAWAVRDARERGHNGGWIMLLFVLCGPFTALIWFVARPRTRLIGRPVDSYHNPEDALTAASQLEMLGEWEAAIELYQVTADRWSQHQDYAETCIQTIRDKQSLA